MLTTAVRRFSTRAFNFSAGPACLPSTVMRRAQNEFCDWDGTGMSIMEMSHRDPGGPVQNALARAAFDLRTLLAVPANYQVLFFQGGAHAQFAAVPLNLLGSRSAADYVHSGFWSQRAIDEASKYCDVSVAADCADTAFSRLPRVDEWKVRDDAAYVHVCANETIHGLEFNEDPDYDVDNMPPLVCDMTSTLLSRPVDVSKYGVIYASGGKNLGPAGAVVVIVRDDLLQIGARKETPSVLDYSKMASSTPIPSIYNTPPTFITYMMGLVFEDLLQKGGVETAQARAKWASGLLYDIIDSSGGFYANHVEPAHRSRMNVPFRIRSGDEQLESKFTQEAAADGLLQVFGHPLFGGQRITLYNGVPDEAVDAVARFMVAFQKRHQ